jgi:hypothetical protein
MLWVVSWVAAAPALAGDTLLSAPLAGLDLQLAEWSQIDGSWKQTPIASAGNTWTALEVQTDKDTYRLVLVSDNAEQELLKLDGHLVEVEQAAAGVAAAPRSIRLADDPLPSLVTPRAFISLTLSVQTWAPVNAHDNQRSLLLDRQRAASVMKLLALMKSLWLVSPGAPAFWSRADLLRDKGQQRRPLPSCSEGQGWDYQNTETQACVGRRSIQSKIVPVGLVPASKEALYLASIGLTVNRRAIAAMTGSGGKLELFPMAAVSGPSLLTLVPRDASAAVPQAGGGKSDDVDSGFPFVVVAWVIGFVVLLAMCGQVMNHNRKRRRDKALNDGRPRAPVRQEAPSNPQDGPTIQQGFEEAMSEAQVVPKFGEDDPSVADPPDRPAQVPEPIYLPPVAAEPPAAFDVGELDNRFRKQRDGLIAEFQNQLRQAEMRIQASVVASNQASLAQIESRQNNKIVSLERSLEAVEGLSARLSALETDLNQVRTLEPAMAAIRELQSHIDQQLDTHTRGLEHQQSLLDHNRRWIEQRSEDLETLRETVGVTDLPGSRDPDWLRVQTLLGKRSGGRVLANALAREIGQLDQDLELLMAFAMALGGRRSLQDENLAKWCQTRAPHGEAERIGQAHTEFRQLREGPLSALRRVGAYLTSKEPLEHPLAKEEREALSQLFVDDDQGGLDRDALVQGMLHKLVTPMLSSSVYLTDACLPERWGRTDGREASQRILRAVQGDLGRASPSMGPDFHLSHLLEKVMAKELQWSWIPARPYLTSETEANQQSRDRGQKPSIRPLSMDSLTDAKGRDKLAPSVLGESMVARVDQPLLVANDGSDGIAPIYRVTRD